MLRIKIAETGRIENLMMFDENGNDVTMKYLLRNEAFECDSNWSFYKCDDSDVDCWGNIKSYIHHKSFMMRREGLCKQIELFIKKYGVMEVEALIWDWSKTERALMLLDDDFEECLFSELEVEFEFHRKMRFELSNSETTSVNEATLSKEEKDISRSSEDTNDKLINTSMLMGMNIESFLNKVENSMYTEREKRREY